MSPRRAGWTRRGRDSQGDHCFQTEAGQGPLQVTDREGPPKALGPPGRQRGPRVWAAPTPGLVLARSTLCGAPSGVHPEGPVHAVSWGPRGSCGPVPVGAAPPPGPLPRPASGRRCGNATHMPLVHLHLIQHNELPGAFDVGDLPAFRALWAARQEAVGFGGQTRRLHPPQPPTGTPGPGPSAGEGKAVAVEGGWVGSSLAPDGSVAEPGPARMGPARWGLPDGLALQAAPRPALGWGRPRAEGCWLAQGRAGAPGGSWPR